VRPAAAMSAHPDVVSGAATPSASLEERPVPQGGGGRLSTPPLQASLAAKEAGQGGGRQLEYKRVITSPSAPSADGGPARRGPTARARTGFDPSQSRGHIIRGWRTGQDTPGPSRASEPVRPSTIQGSYSLVHPWDGGPERSARALMLPRYRPDRAQSPQLTRHTSGGRSVKELGHSSCPAPACHARPITHHARDGGPAREALGRYRPDHSTSHRPTTVVPKGQRLK